MIKTIVEFKSETATYRIVRMLDGHRLQTSAYPDYWTTIATGPLAELLMDFGGMVGSSIDSISVLGAT